MKFITPVLFLLASTFAFADKATNSTADAGSSIDEKCEKEVSQYKDCFVPYGKFIENYKEVCPPTQTEKCQKVYQDPKSLIPNCLRANYLRYEEINNINLSCKLDEKGELCPIAKSYVDKSKYSKKDTCKSKACTDSIIAFIEKSIPLLEDSNTFDYVNILFGNDPKVTTSHDLREDLKFYQSEECTNANTSDAKTLKIGTAFIVSLGLLLLSFY